MMQRLIFVFSLISLIIFSSCSQLNKATDLVTNPSAKERYQRDFNISNDLFNIWENQVELALNDSIQIHLPYAQAGKFTPKGFQIFSYNVLMNIGEKLEISVETDSISQLVFIDLYRQENDSLKSYKKVESSAFNKSSLSREIEKPGLYKAVIQPEINANSFFSIKIKKTSIYEFPVAGGTNRSIQSFWGAARDGGRRSHEGIDIFAPRGTPVIAVTDGRITSSGERGLGGKQVWLRDTKRGQSLYYAHLDSIVPLGNARVKTGDTIGFVGNTGNARTTAPHLHFGIYKGYGGAIDPLPHVYLIDEPEFENPGDFPETQHLITQSSSNLRDQPTTNRSTIIANLPARDTLRFLGKTNEWYHVRTADNQAAFIHQSLVAPL